MGGTEVSVKIVQESKQYWEAHKLNKLFAVSHLTNYCVFSSLQNFFGLYMNFVSLRCINNFTKAAWIKQIRGTQWSGTGNKSVLMLHEIRSMFPAVFNLVLVWTHLRIEICVQTIIQTQFIITGVV